MVFGFVLEAGENEDEIDMMGGEGMQKECRRYKYSYRTYNRDYRVNSRRRGTDR